MHMFLYRKHVPKIFSIFLDKALIMEQREIEVLRKWHKSAAKAQSIEDFERAVELVSSEK